MPPAEAPEGPTAHEAAFVAMKISAMFRSCMRVNDFPVPATPATLTRSVLSFEELVPLLKFLELEAEQEALPVVVHGAYGVEVVTLSP